MERFGIMLKFGSIEQNEGAEEEWKEKTFWQPGGNKGERKGILDKSDKGSHHFKGQPVRFYLRQMRKERGSTRTRLSQKQRNALEKSLWARGARGNTRKKSQTRAHLKRELEGGRAGRGL